MPVALSRLLTRVFLATLLLGPFAACPPAQGAGGKLRLKTIDQRTGEQIPCRLHLKNAKGKPVKIPGLPFWHDHVVFSGEVTLELPKGRYTFELERGPEYRDWTGHFEIENNFSNDSKEIEMERIVDMAENDWWSADLHVHRPLKDIELLMLAEDLRVTPVITWWNDKNEWGKSKSKPPAELVTKFDTDRYYEVMAGEDEREGGALLYFGLPRPLKLTGSSREFPSPMTFLEEARREAPAGWVDIEKPFWWDTPVWLALGKVDSIGLAHNHMHRDGVMDNEAWGKPRDKKTYRGKLGNGQWTQDIYYHALNCGLRIPPSAGSASGVLPNPVGYNRMYVHVKRDEFDYAAFWRNFALGRVVVTNGPLLLPLAAGELPGHVFTIEPGEPLVIPLRADMHWRDKIAYVEVIKNGKVATSTRIEEWSKNGHFPPVTFEDSGWFLIRAVTELDKTYRFVSSGPWYVEATPGARRVSKSSAKFFLDWTQERAARIKLEDADERRQVLAYFEQASAFWQNLIDTANAD